MGTIPRKNFLNVPAAVFKSAFSGVADDKLKTALAKGMSLVFEKLSVEMRGILAWLETNSLINPDPQIYKSVTVYNPDDGNSFVNMNVDDAGSDTLWLSADNGDNQIIAVVHPPSVASQAILRLLTPSARIDFFVSEDTDSAYLEVIGQQAVSPTPFARIEAESGSIDFQLHGGGAFGLAHQTLADSDQCNAFWRAGDAAASGFVGANATPSAASLQIVLDSDEGVFGINATTAHVILDHGGYSAFSAEDTGGFLELNSPNGARIFMQARDAGATKEATIYMRESDNDPGALANNAAIFCKDNGAGKTQLCVRFPTGAVQVLATEP